MGQKFRGVAINMSLNFDHNNSSSDVLTNLTFSNDFFAGVLASIIAGLIVWFIQWKYGKQLASYFNKFATIGKTGLDGRFKDKTIQSLVFSDNTEAALFFNEDKDYHEFTKHFIDKSEGHYLVINTASLKDWQEILGDKKEKHDASRIHLIYDYKNGKTDFFTLDKQTETKSYDIVFRGRGNVKQIEVLDHLPDITETGNNILGTKLYEIAVDCPEDPDKDGRICLVYSHRRDNGNKRVFFIHVKVIENKKLLQLIDKIKDSCMIHILQG